MKVEGFKDWLAEQLQNRGVDVSRYDVASGLSDLAVRGEGAEYRLRIVRTSPPGGERPDDANTVQRPAGTAIEVRRPD
ncbi:hypothetical protein B1813_08335 [Saccharomonospora piscinae]|uniref:Uncharacterized protein n=1 Tax=Saccharomonospora piscinae TaxID=687388 RepID=A0A1V9A514_SACPI|nr:hypothetical protein [Saccharomonospora piscinae]OQO92232.1 hypothetical protein B1813_08335 [Saccharomonospora piscinae]TLW92064.1 hypothetical protein FFT09_14340 [Saccharomonospora piscinae]